MGIILFWKANLSTYFLKTYYVLPGLNMNRASTLCTIFALRTTQAR